MAINVASPDVKSVTLTTWSGLCTNINPVALPQGSSPDNSDCSFLPSGVFSRSCFQKALATPLGSVTVAYGKSYVDPSGIIRDFYLDSAGNFWMEIIAPSNLAAVPTVIFTTTPGSSARSITANGREYVAIHNGLQGADIPYQLTGLPDGTVQIDRVTQDGPGASPTVVSIAYPSVALANTAGSDPTFTIAGVYPDQKTGGVYTALNIYYSAGTPSTAPVGSSVTASGLSGGFAVFNGTYTVIANPGPDGAITVGTYYTGSQSGSVAGTLTVNIAGTSLVRTDNVVTAQTASAHMLKPGYQSQIAGVAAGNIGTSISSIVIDNESSSGIATVTTSTAHGLVPGQDTNVSITGVTANEIASATASFSCVGEIGTVIMASPTAALSPGAFVTLASFSNAAFNGIVQALSVATTTVQGDTFTFAMNGEANIAPIVDATGTVSINWPIPNTAAPILFNVIAAPTDTTFQIQINYSDGAWTSGFVGYAWDGTFYVQTVPSSTTFTYQQYGPNDSAVFASGQTATPYGQAAPGKHQMQVFFIDRQGGTTAPSPPVTFIANGGQYVSVTNIPIGPSPHIIARAIAFTGADGAYFFYIPSPPQENGQIVGTATQINDNVTTSAVFDFGDPTLFAALGISIPGNNLANQVVIDGSLWFGYYGSRILTGGQRNVVGGLLNMGFDGGFFGINATSIQSGSSYTIEFVGTTNFVSIGASSNTVGVVFTATGTGTGTGVVASNPVLPTGWSGGGSGSLVAGHYGGGWRVSATALTQSMYEDYSGAPIAEANDLYTFRAWVSAAGSVTATISSSSTSFSSTATITAVGAGFGQANFSVAMPNVIPSDLTFGITGTNSVVVDEMSIIYTQSPIDIECIGSYVNNPEGFDGLTGVFAPEDDTHQVMGVFIIRSALYMLTLDPNGRLHETSQGSTEPAEWVISEVASNCGLVGVAALTQSQADDSTASGGEEWEAWYSSDGPRIFGGSTPDKIAQEIQRPAGQAFPGAPPDLGAFNVAAQLTTWALNDPSSKTLYFGIPANSATAPSVIWQMSYLGMDSAEQIANSPPVHRALSGKLVTSDLARKWSPWQRAMNGAALMFRQTNIVQPVFFNGNGITPGTSSVGAYGNVYLLNPGYYTDDDYGRFFPYYTTYAFVDRDTEQQMDLGGGLKTVSYSFTTIAGVGLLTPQLLYNFLNQPWSIQGQNGTESQYPLSLVPPGDLEWSGIMAQGYRFFYKIAPIPNPAGSTAKPATDVKFSLSSFTLCLRKKSRGGSVSGRYNSGPV